MLIETRTLKKSINLTGKNSHSSGAFCSYYKYNDTQGIKVLYSSGHTTIKSLRKSQVWRRGTKENTMLKKCRERYKNIPKTFGVFPIKIGSYFYPGIVMQHIPGKTLNNLFPKLVGDDYNTKKTIAKDFKKILKNFGIYHSDLNFNNIIFNEIENVYYIIDFTYDLVGLDAYPRNVYYE